MAVDDSSDVAAGVEGRIEGEKSSLNKEPSEVVEEELDPRAAFISRLPVCTDVTEHDLQIIMDAALRAYNKYVLVPTKNTWRKEEGSRKELERDVERVAMCDIAASIKKDISSKLGGCWHVVYGHDFATFVTHKKLSFCQFTIEGSNVVAWRHGR